MFYSKKGINYCRKVYNKHVIDISIRHFSSNAELFKRLGLSSTDANPGVFNGCKWEASGDIITSINPSTGMELAKIQLGSLGDYNKCVKNMHLAKKDWMSTPPPIRGDIVRQIGNVVRSKKEDIARLITLEVGKTFQESLGEVQEFVDICDMAVGISRQIPGAVFPSERRDHLILETWNPLGTIGIITAFNFPFAVAGWNSAISLICGNTQILKGSETTSLVNIVIQKIFNEVLQKNNIDGGVTTLCQGYGNFVGEYIIRDNRIDLVSFTGSTDVGRRVGAMVGCRFGRTILELGGNNAMIIDSSINMNENIDIDIAVKSVLFAAIGTNGQRCTSLRRLYIHSSNYDVFLKKLQKMYSKIKIGNPNKKGIDFGPLHSNKATEQFKKTIETIKKQGGKVIYGGKRIYESDCPPTNFVQPTLVEIDPKKDIVKEESFLPILYVMKYESLDEAIKLNNSVKHGLASSLFTNDVKKTFKWISEHGSDTGITNVNTSCNGAEVGASFGGNKHSGWGRESGSDAWKQYMRRGTCTINYGDELPLAQGIEF